MRKKTLSLSIATLMTAIISSNVMAFDDIGSAGYQGDLLPLSGTTPLANNLLHSPKESDVGLRLYSITPVKPQNIFGLADVSGRGDALIFPFFNQKDDWGTEFVVRNTNKHHAIVAKVEVYSSSDSQSILDFNVYLSGADVVRFKIENGKLISEDGSVVTHAPAPSSNLNDVEEEDFASKTNPFTRDVNVESGYVVVYGMAQAKDDDDDVDSHDSRYHNQHARLFANYRRELDVCRPGWRTGHRTAMKNGTYQRGTIVSYNPIAYSGTPNYSIPAPNQSQNCLTGGSATGNDIKAGNFFGDVGEHLSGTVRLYNGTNSPRDMVLPAKAIKNFTWNNKIIWTEGEVGSLADRRIVGQEPDGNGGITYLPWAKYNETGIREDAKAFAVVNTAYTFNADSVANQLIITQPYKRTLLNFTTPDPDNYWPIVATGDSFRRFSYIYNVFNEDEKMLNEPYTHSPYDSTIDLGKNEVEIMKDLEAGTAFKGENGFALLKFVNGAGKNAYMPAIITQMIGSTVGGIPQVNWIYSPTSLFLNEDCVNPSSVAANPNELPCDYD